MSCPQAGQRLVVSIRNSEVLPRHTRAARCSRLTINNFDNQVRLVAFGEHDNHQPYDGVTEKVLAQGQSLTITLNQTGTFRFHDHLEDSVQGDFTVVP